MPVVQETGFTLFELLVAMAVLAILASIATPGFRNLIDDSRLKQARAQLEGDLNTTRIESAKRRQRLVVCARADDTSCGTDWSKGWLVYADLPGGVANVLDTTDTVLRTRSISPQHGIQIAARSRGRWSSTVSNTSLLVFENRSRVTGGTLFVLCDGRGAESAQQIAIASPGSTHSEWSYDLDGDRVDPWGNSLGCSLSG